MVRILVITVVKMKARVIAGKVYIPKDIRKKAKLVERSECEMVMVGDEIRIMPAQPDSLNALRALKKPGPKAGVEEMVKAEEVEDV